MQLPQNIEQFNVKDCIIDGKECVLITPKSMGVDWDEHNKYFRSSIWTKSQMKPVSLGFRKFMNLGEAPSFESIDDYTDLELIRKVDGSCLIVSKFGNTLITRTRGTVDASTLPNGHEIEFLKQKYPKVFNLEDSAWFNPDDYTFLYEWTTPTNRIVLDETSEPTLWLIGAIRHEDYSYISQSDLDTWAIGFNVLRPERFPLTLPQMKEFLESNATIEGVVIYANDGQYLKKVKTPRYLYLHRVFTGLKTLDQLTEVWAKAGYLEIKEFKHYLGSTFDWELVTSLEPLLKELELKCSQLNQKFTEIKTFISELTKQTNVRSEQAKVIIQTYGPWSGIAFNFLDSNFKNKPEKLFKLL